MRRTRSEPTVFFRIIWIAVLTAAFFFAGCPGDEDDDEDGVIPGGGSYPTTLDMTLVPVRADLDGGGEGYTLGTGPGEPRTVRNDLNVTPRFDFSSDSPLSVVYFLTVSDTHLTDEESPTRLTFFDSDKIFFGAFESAYRPQEDLTPHTLAGVVRSANRIMADYDRDFDLAFVMGDITDNAQENELLWAMDVLDGNGATSGMPGVCRPDSGDLDIDPETGWNRGERNFGAQEINALGDVINPFFRPDRSDSNADFPAAGLAGAEGLPVPWLGVIGNHDALNTGNFNPDDESLTFFSREDYVGGVARYGLQAGLANVIAFAEENPGLPIHIADGIFGTDVDFGKLARLLLSIGMVPDDYYEDYNPNFDLSVLINGTFVDPADDGIFIAPDAGRAFAGEAGMIRLLHESGHGFSDNNGDSAVDLDDGGYYAVDFESLRPGRPLPLRFLVLNTAQKPTMAAGGMTEAQFSWLTGELNRAVVDQVLVIVCSHHQSHGLAEGKERLIELLQAVPNVVAHLTGHGHFNEIIPHIVPGDPLRSYWEVQTPSTTTFPQQARIIEIVDHRDGTGSIVLTLFDHSLESFEDADDLANLGRWIAFQDVIRLGYRPGQFNGLGGRGTTADRNRELIFAIPDEVAFRLAEIPAAGPVTSWESFGR